MTTSITITISDDRDPHVCDPMCDCPTALYRTQAAIDTARREDRAQPRGLSERLQAMRYAAPTTAWFEEMALEAARLETMAATSRVRDWILRDHPDSDAAVWAAECDAADAMTPTESAAALHRTIEATVRDLERAQLLPIDHECVHDAMGDSLVWAGNRKFKACMTGSLDTPARNYLVTTSRDDDDEPGAERITNNLADVRAWLLAWGVATVDA